MLAFAGAQGKYNHSRTIVSCGVPQAIAGHPVKSHERQSVNMTNRGLIYKTPPNREFLYSKQLYEDQFPKT